MALGPHLSPSSSIIFIHGLSRASGIYNERFAFYMALTQQALARQTSFDKAYLSFCLFFFFLFFSFLLSAI